MSMIGTGRSLSRYRSVLEELAEQAGLAELPRSARVALIMPRGKDGLLGFLAVSSYAICVRWIRDCSTRNDRRMRDLDVAGSSTNWEPRIASIAERLKIGTAQTAVPTVLRRCGKASEWRTQANEVALLLQTSGTTSKPKHVALTHSIFSLPPERLGQVIPLARTTCASSDAASPRPWTDKCRDFFAACGASQYCAPSFSPAPLRKPWSC